MKTNQLKTKGNRDRWKRVPQGYLYAGNTNPGPNHLETPLVDREPMKIEIAVNTFPRGISMRGTRIRGPITSKSHWSTGNQWKSRSLETRSPGVSRCGKDDSGAQSPQNPIGRRGTNGNRERWKSQYMNGGCSETLECGHFSHGSYIISGPTVSENELFPIDAFSEVLQSGGFKAGSMCQKI